MKVERVNLIVTLVSIPTTGHLPALSSHSRVPLSQCIGLTRTTWTARSRNTAKKLEQVLGEKAVPIDRSSRDCFGFSKLETIEDNVNHIRIYQGSCSISKMLPVAESFAKGTRTTRSPMGYVDRNTLLRAPTYGSESIGASMKVTPSQMDLRLRLPTERQPLETPQEVETVRGNKMLD